ncbi:MAG: GNAT family N-acetyltransferase [Candidatus Omnitrophica bacterium]|nr:GNAT family N-acetyltransferase [Candidatus Omnitrophota bacterium]
MQIEVIKDIDKFQKMRSEWNALLEASGVHNPFLRHEWLTAWWKGYGDGKELFVLMFKNEREAVGFMPLMRYRTKLGIFPVSAIGFFPNHWVEIGYFLKNDCDQAEAAGLLADLFIREKKFVILSYFRAGSNSLNSLIEAIRARRAYFRLVPKIAPYIEMTGDWQGYLKGRSYRFRAEYKKKLASLLKEGTLELQRFQDVKNHPEVFGHLKTISRASWQGLSGVAILSSEEGERFYGALFLAWGPMGLLDISVLFFNKAPIAYLVGFNFKGHFYVFDTAYDEFFKEFSPGMVIHNKLLEKLFPENIRIFDFGYEAEYKKRWTESAADISDLILCPKSFSGAVLAGLYAMKRILKKKEGVHAS